MGYISLKKLVLKYIYYKNFLEVLNASCLISLKTKLINMVQRLYFNLFVDKRDTSTPWAKKRWSRCSLLSWRAKLMSSLVTWKSCTGFTVKCSLRTWRTASQPLNWWRFVLLIGLVFYYIVVMLNISIHSINCW